MADSKETVLGRLLANIPDEYDKTEGSFFYDAEAPVAEELASAYSEQEAILNKGFVETATGEYLNYKVAEQGIIRKAAIKATATVTVTGAEGASMAIGDLVASDTANYAATEAKTIAAGQTTMDVAVECVTAGSIGNVPVGAIKYFPITLQGLIGVTNALAVTNGYDAETDAALRQRYYEKVQTPATSGNKYHYRNWAKEVAGVGDARVFPLWNGAGTVKVVIIDSNMTGAEAELVTATETYIEEVRPIGATVTVASATEKAINVNATLTIDTDNYTLAQVKASIEANITAHLKEIAFIEDYVSYAKIGNIILSTAGVLDYASLLVNSGTANISIAETEVAVLGVVTVA